MALKLSIWLLALHLALGFEEKYYYKVISDKSKQWLGCCNDPFLPDPVLDAIPQVYAKCKQEIGEDQSDCFQTCVFKALGFYGPNGIDKAVVKKMMGSANMLGDPSGWKKANADKILDSCFKEIKEKGIKDCSADVRKVGTCFWEKVFKKCPSLNAAKC